MSRGQYLVELAKKKAKDKENTEGDKSTVLEETVPRPSPNLTPEPTFTITNDTPVDFLMQIPSVSGEGSAVNLVDTSWTELLQATEGESIIIFPICEEQLLDLDPGNNSSDKHLLQDNSIPCNDKNYEEQSLDERLQENPDDPNWQPSDSRPHSENFNEDQSDLELGISNDGPTGGRVNQDHVIENNENTPPRSKGRVRNNNYEGPRIDERLEEDPDDPDWQPPDNQSDSENSNEDHSDVELGDNQDHELEYNENNDSGRKRRGRKRKVEDETKDIRKKRKNSNLNYHNYKGVLVESKNFINFKCKCIKKCDTLVSTEVRKSEFEKFWNLGDYNAQNMFIGSCVNEAQKKRQYTNKCSKRKFSRTYTIRSIPVCRDLFIRNFGISTKRVNTALTKLRSEDMKDKRGVKQGGKNKITDQQFAEVIDHINGLPKYKSHYRRENTNSEFLSPEMTLQKMFEMYVREKIDKAKKNNSDDQELKNLIESNESDKKILLLKVGAVSFSSYRRIFLNNFNLKFKKLKKDTCNKCDTFKARVSGAGAEERRTLEEAHNIHLSQSEEAREKLKADTKESQNNNQFECLTFDLEKTLPLPRIPTNIIFYKRQLWLYNAGVHSCKTGQGFCYVWSECDGGRGSQEIGSCLKKHIENCVSDSVENLVLWCDSCGGQNRNIKIVLILKACLESHPSLKTIKIKYLVPGHTFLPNDTDFSDIECALKHVQRLYLPEDYIDIIKQSRRKKPFIVVRMKSSDFIGTEKLEKKIINRKKTEDEDPKKINWLKIREICLKKDEPMKMYCRSDFSSPYDCVDFQRKPKKGEQATKVYFKNSLIPMWVEGKEIAAPKLKDLKSIMHLIPADAKPFYQNLTGSRAVEDDIDGFCGSLDFEIEGEEY